MPLPTPGPPGAAAAAATTAAGPPAAPAALPFLQSLESLDPDTLELVLRELQLADLRSGRRACKALLRPLSERVHTLASLDHLAALPASAWQAFPGADGLRVEHKGESKTAARALLGTLRSSPSRLKRLQLSMEVTSSKVPAIASQVLSLLFARHCSQASGPADNEETAAGGSSQAEAQLTEVPAGPAPVAGGEPMALQQLLLEMPISGAQASNLVSKLTGLQQLSLRLEATATESHTICLQPSEALQSLALCTQHSPYMQVDLASLCSSARGLRRLHLHGALLALPALAQLPQLHHLHLVDCSVATGQGAAGLGDVLCSLTQLRELELPQLDCSSALWQRLVAACPRLQSVWFMSLQLREVHQPCGLTRLNLNYTDYAHSWGRRAHPLVLEGASAAQPEGCLQRLMPRLQELAVGAAGPGAWSAAAAGHPELQRLRMCWYDPSRLSDQAERLGDLQLSSWPKLHAVKLRLGYGSCSRADALLQHLGQCAMLVDLEVLAWVSNGYQISSRQGVQALVSGPAGQSLRRVSFNCRPEPELATFLPLLAPGLHIRQVDVEVALPGLEAVEAALRSRQEEGRGATEEAELVAAVHRQLPSGLGVQVSSVSAKLAPAGYKQYLKTSWRFEALVGGRCQLRCAGGQDFPMILFSGRL